MNSRLLKVATFNLFNLVLPEVSYYRGMRYSPEGFAQKQSWIGNQLRQMDGDIVGFQEVFHEEALRQVLRTSGCYEGAEVRVAPLPEGGPGVGLVSRFPVVKHRVITDFPAAAQLDIEGVRIPLRKFSHPVLSVRLRLTPTVHCTVFVVHLKSKRPLFPDMVDRTDPIERAKAQARSLIVRAAEATALRLVLLDVLRHRDYPVMVLGDVNDGDLAVTSQILTGEIPQRGYDAAKKEEMLDVLLYQARDIQARQSFQDVYYTHIHDGHYESLDHIMVSQEFVAENPKRVGQVRYVAVLNDHLIDQTLSDEDIKSWQSDHGQVVASIEMDVTLERL